MKKFITLTLCTGDKISVIAKDIVSIREDKPLGMKRTIVGVVGGDEWVVDEKLHSVEQ